MSQAQLPNELATFLENWTTDPNNAKDAFVRFKDFLLTTPDVRFDFKARPGVSYSLRAANAKNDERPLFVLVDVVDDEPALQNPKRYAMYFIDKLEHAGAVEWTGQWSATEHGRAYLHADNEN